MKDLRECAVVNINLNEIKVLEENIFLKKNNNYLIGVIITIGVIGGAYSAYYFYNKSLKLKIKN